jgi:hypothetical protein
MEASRPFEPPACLLPLPWMVWGRRESSQRKRERDKIFEKFFSEKSKRYQK